MNSLDEKELLDSIKVYCRLDDCFEEELKDLKEASEEYLKNAGIVANYENKLYFLAIKMLVLHFYDNKGITSNKTEEIPYGITCIINQLQMGGLAKYKC
ncbi:TPA: head-tail connector protein [Clostridioides difficile]|uniref:head-tail connector protein n=1 Tax=Clostridioides sp. ES-S-0049-03 TaxID=2770779 RepID=UPI001D117833|nr:phage gp6-like head-tail connector protein [Clostridioides sp. ES-S-0049-03]HEK4853241.1 phage gp6-like head-tail connector protein [Clostridioides difficile]